MEWFLKVIAIFRSSVVCRARCWFPFSPCSLNMPWPGFPHVVRMVHHYGLHWSFIVPFFYTFLPSVFPSHSFLQNKAPLVLPDFTAWCSCEPFLFLLLFLVLSHVCCIWPWAGCATACILFFLPCPPPFFFPLRKHVMGIWSISCRQFVCKPTVKKA